MQMPGAVDPGLRAAEQLRSAGDPWDVANVLWYPHLALVTLGRLDEVAKMGDELEPLATRVGHLGALINAGRARAGRELMLTGEVDSCGEFARADMGLCQRTGFPWVSNSYTWLGRVDFWRGCWPQALENFEEAARLEPPGFSAWAGRGGVFFWEGFT